MKKTISIGVYPGLTKAMLNYRVEAVVRFARPK